MKWLSGSALRQMYMDYFLSLDHKQIKGASLIPENDPTVLFTTAGMHPLVPYLLGQPHPMGTRLTDVQKCIRTGDIDDVGDDSHATFFEMLGNWSLGDYFKREAIQWSYTFLTDEIYLGIDPEDLAVTVFTGDDDAPRDLESYQVWKSLGFPEERIFFLEKEHNWWGPAGLTGPCGPDTEMFLIRKDKEPCGPDCSPACGCGRYLEIWNDVFMEYNKTAEGSFEPLVQKNVDTGMGLDRTIAVLQGASSVYETDLYLDIIRKVEELTGKKATDGEMEKKRAIRIVADHVRTATHIMGDERGVAPSNEGQGYVLRRLIRRAVRFGRTIALPDHALSRIAQVVIDTYKDTYPELEQNRTFILEELSQEELQFGKTLGNGTRMFNRVADDAKGVIDGESAFHLYDTHGFPIELTQEMAQERGLSVDMEGFERAFSAHREKSRGDGQKNAGGMADHTEETTRLHTATHLLLASLKKVLGEEVNQRGSQITVERLRFDFNFERKLTEEEKQQTEDLVNDAIRRDMPITMEEMTVDEAREAGATGVFEDRYGQTVKVYTMGDFSKEICGGPHASRTGELGIFRIQKEESSSRGVRRIRAVLE